MKTGHCEASELENWIIHDGACSNHAIKYVNGVLFVLALIWIVYLFTRLWRFHKEMNLLQFSIMIAFITTLFFRLLYLLDPFVAYFSDSLYYLWELIPVVAITSAMILILLSWVELTILAKYPGESIEKRTNAWKLSFLMLLFAYLIFSVIFLIVTIAKRHDGGGLFESQFLIDLIFCVGCGTGFLFLGTLLIGRIKKTSTDLFQSAKCRIVTLTILSLVACVIRAAFSIINIFFQYEYIDHLQKESLIHNDGYWALFVFFYLFLGEIMPVVVLSFVLRLSISEEDMIDEGSIMQMLTDQQANSNHNALVNTSPLSDQLSRVRGGTTSVKQAEDRDEDLDFERRRYQTISDDDESEYH